MKLKTTPEYVTLVPGSKGGPRNGHYAELDPHFAAVRPAAEAMIAGLYKADDWETFRNNWKGEAPLPEGTPRPGTDIEETYIKMPTRDGNGNGSTEIELKVMRSVKNNKAKPEDNVCVIRLHGGGWTIGWHGTEAIENLHAAGHPNVVLVSVDYRLAPEHPFPTPLHDCVDALKWIKANAVSHPALQINPDKIVLLGGSAGSGLALAVALQAREEHITGLWAMLLDWPTGSHPKFFPQLREKYGYELESYVQVPDGVVAGAIVMEFFLDAHTPDAQPDPLHSPLLADSFKDLPPACMFWAPPLPSSCMRAST